MKNKNFKEHIAYSAREILLIVISIFLAIQLNNWNSRRKNNKRAIEYLVEIKNDLNTDTIAFGKIAEIGDKELELYANRLNTVDYKSLSLDSLNKFIINSYAMDYAIKDNSYQKILNLGLPRLSDNEELERLLNNYYNGMSNRLKSYVKYDYEQTKLEHSFWFYDQSYAEMYLSSATQFPFIESNNRREDLIKLLSSVKARNYMRTEYFRSEQLNWFINFLNRTAKLLIQEIEKEIELKK